MLLLAVALASAAPDPWPEQPPLKLGGGAQTSVGLQLGYGTELQRALGDHAQRPTTHQSVQVRFDAVVAPAVAICLEGFGAKALVRGNWVLYGSGGNAYAVDTLHANFFAGMGTQVGNERQELQVALGPTVGASGYAPASYRVLKQDHGVAPSPYELGGRLRIRGRTQVGRRLAFEARAGVGMVYLTQPSQYLLPSRRVPTPPGPFPGTPSLRLDNAVEAQVRLFTKLWVTGGLRLEDVLYLDEQVSDLEPRWIHVFQAQLGVRWR